MRTIDVFSYPSSINNVSAQARMRARRSCGVKTRGRPARGAGLLALVHTITNGMPIYAPRRNNFCKFCHARQYPAVAIVAVESGLCHGLLPYHLIMHELEQGTIVRLHLAEVGERLVPLGLVMGISSLRPTPVDVLANLIRDSG
ncbi:hypothetical protein RHIZ_15350 [Rhizobium skierniewicense]|uniref:hypothetical protein n=1 Tax=Rhizobium skierniewicense TaxID=984260 RepID=UPI001FACBA78|nr:hypothetical protein [Rhizobium skierniewicense]MCI9867330.1 hypothetical protein [Rhizobium skierniewicense]